jgi:hypothetical protein
MFAATITAAAIAHRPNAVSNPAMILLDLPMCLSPFYLAHYSTIAVIYELERSLTSLDSLLTLLKIIKIMRTRKILFFK